MAPADAGEEPAEAESPDPACVAPTPEERAGHHPPAPLAREVGARIPDPAGREPVPRPAGTPGTPRARSIRRPALRLRRCSRHVRPPARPHLSSTCRRSRRRARRRLRPPLPSRRFVEVVLPASAVIGLQVDRPLSSETARVEDRVDARVTRDVMAAGRRAIPAGSRMLGSVIARRARRQDEGAARLGVRFHTLVLADGT